MAINIHVDMGTFSIVSSLLFLKMIKIGIGNTKTKRTQNLHHKIFLMQNLHYITI